MAKHGDVPDRYDAWVTPDAAGAWTFEIQAWSDPVATWQHAAGLKIPAGVDVDLMFTEGRLLLERVLVRPWTPTSADARVLQGAIEAASDVGRPPEARLAVLQDPGLVDVLHRHPLRELVTVEGPYPAYADRELRAVRQLVRVLPALRGRDRGHRRARSPAAPSGPPRSGWTRWPRWASTSSTCRRSTRSARSTARAPTTPSTPAPTTPGRRGRSGRKDGGHDAIHPDLGTLEDFDAFVAHADGLGLEVALDLALQAAPDHPWVTTHPRVLHHPRRRDHRLRREPAEEVPGHLPDELRQRPGRDLPRGAAGRQALDVARRPGLPGRQPAHQAGRVLGVAAQGDPAHRPRRDLPVRGVHPAADDARPGRGRLPPVLHVLHLAHRQVGARGVPPRGLPRVRPH